MAWAPDYATTANVKSYERIGDSVDDGELGVYITAASRAIDKACGRQFGLLATATKWTYTAEYNRHRGCWVVTIDDLATTTGLVVEVDGVTTTDYTLNPLQAVAKGKVWTRIMLGSTVGCSGDRDGIAVTARWGWSSVPVAIEHACMLQASRFAARRDSPYGIAGSPNDGSEMRLLASVDPDVRVSVGPYVRVRGAS